MREIKFRAYHIEQEKMISIENLLSFSNDGDIWINENKQMPLNVFSGWASKDFKLMQYTGLKDKNGDGLTEVYEGDIVSIDGTLKGNIYENDKEPTDIVIPQLGTKAWADAYKEAVDRGYNYSE